MPAALNNSLKKFLEHSTKKFQSSNKKDLPHHDFASYLNTDLDKFMFDLFYEMFVVNKGEYLYD